MARKRSIKTSDGRDGDDFAVDYGDSAPTSRMRTPFFHSIFLSHSASLSADDDIEHMDLDDDYSTHRQHTHSNGSSDDDYEEADTSPPSAP